MKHLQVRALAILMTCWCASIAQVKASEPASAKKAASSDSSGAGAGAKAKPSVQVKAETKHKVFIERRQAEGASQEAVDSHLRKIRRERALDAKQERAADEKREKMGRTPDIGAKTAKDSTGSKK